MKQNPLYTCVEKETKKDNWTRRFFMFCLLFNVPLTFWNESLIVLDLIFVSLSNAFNFGQKPVLNRNPWWARMAGSEN